MTEELGMLGRAALNWPFPVDPADWASVLGGVPFPAALWCGSEMRFRWANDPFLDMLGPSPRFDALGMPVKGFLSDATSAVRFQDAAYTGLPVADPHYEYRDLDTGRKQFWHLTFMPVPAKFAQPYDVLMVAVNVTSRVSEERQDREHREELRAAVDLIDATILSTLDAEEILQRVVVEATEAFNADWGWIALREPGAWVFRNVHGWPEEIVGKRFSEDELSLPKLCADERAVVAADDPFNGPSEHRRLMQKHDIEAFLLIPLISRGEVEGVVGFSWNCETRFASIQLEMAEKLAVSLSLALRNAHAFEAEHELTRKLQSAFFTVPPALKGLEIGHLYHSASAGARVGGDFYDVVYGGNSHVGLVMGDVGGHGVDSTAFTTLVKSAMRMHALEGSSPRNVVQQANTLVLRDSPPDVYVSAFFGSLDLETGHLAYCSAGHPAPVLLRKGGEAIPLPRRQVLMGVDGTVSYENAEAHIGNGDMLLMYTDGLVEARDRNGRTYGESRLLQSLKAMAEERTEAIPEHLFMDAFSWADGRLTDDVAIMALRRSEEELGQAQERLQLDVA